MPRTFGIELEIVNISRDNVAIALQAAGVPCEVESYNHTVRRHWKITTDASVHGTNYSCEVVSPILRGEEGITEARKVARVLELMGAEVNKTCGFHLHIGANDLSNEQMRNFAKLYLKYEKTASLLIPKTRRGSNNPFLKDNLTKCGGDVDAAFNEIDRASNFEDLRVMLCGWSSNDRYYKLNLQAYVRQGTFEIRMHSGTCSPDKIANWVRLWLGVMETAVTATNRINLPSDGFEELPIEQRVRRFMRHANMATEITRFYVKRAAELNQPSRRRVAA